MTSSVSAMLVYIRLAGQGNDSFHHESGTHFFHHMLSDFDFFQYSGMVQIFFILMGRNMVPVVSR